MTLYSFHLHAFFFDPRWIDYISYLISSPIILILLNGFPMRNFNPSLGIHQGDPLSPFLFILVEDGLGCYIKSVVQVRVISGIHMWGNDILLSHQQFVDDIMLFFLSLPSRSQGLNNHFPGFHASLWYND